MARQHRKASKAEPRRPDTARLRPEQLESRNVLSPCVPALLGDFDLQGGMADDAEVTLFGGDWNDDFVMYPGGDANAYGGDGDDTLTTTPGGGGGTLPGGGGDTLPLGVPTNPTLYGADGDDTLTTVTGGGSGTLSGGGGGDLTLGGGGARPTLFGGDGDDTIAVTGGMNVTVFGDAGDDSLVVLAGTQVTVFGGEGNDSLSVGGAGTQVTVFGGDGDTLTVGGTATQVTVFGGDGNDSLTVTAGTQVTVFGTASDDTVIPVTNSSDIDIFGGEGDTLTVGGGTQVTVFGGDGDDSIAVLGGTQVTVFGGDGDDTIAVLGGTQVTIFGGDGDDSVNLTAVSSGSITVFGGIGDDTILVTGSGSEVTVFGWDADDRFVAAPTRGPAAGSASVPGQPTSVFVDFDSDTGRGEWAYTPAERNAVLGRLRDTFAAFRFEFLSAPPSFGPFIHVAFNAGPAGGSSSQLDLGDRLPGGDATVNVNGLLGRPGGVPLDSASVTAVSATIAAHEIGHLLGLRHADAFGPIGSGVYLAHDHDDLGYLPQYEPGDAAETAGHIMGSPRSIGMPLAAAAGVTYFGEREAIKLSFALGGLTVGEDDLPQLESGSRLLGALPALAVPNTLAPGALRYGDTFDVGAMAIAGTITLGADGHSENDTYAFFGRAGELVNIEISSASRAPFAGNPIDSVLRVLDSAGRQIVWNDDGFESTDSEIIDLRLPADGIYYVVVDTYTPDGITDSDIGNYDLFISRFASTPGLTSDPGVSAAESTTPTAVDATAPLTGPASDTVAGIWLPPDPVATRTDRGSDPAPTREASADDSVRLETTSRLSTTDDPLAAISTPYGDDSTSPSDDLSLSLQPTPAGR